MAKSRNGTASLGRLASISALAALSAGTTSVVSLAMIRLVTGHDAVGLPGQRVRLVQIARAASGLSGYFRDADLRPLEQPQRYPASRPRPAAAEILVKNSVSALVLSVA